MGGSLNHIVDDGGEFTFELIENLGDAEEMAQECFALIHHLSGGDFKKVRAACKALGFPVPKHPLVTNSNPTTNGDRTCFYCGMDEQTCCEGRGRGLFCCKDCVFFGTNAAHGTRP